jgi:predicted DNA-binding protein YlxM (UPF0122 family)
MTEDFELSDDPSERDYPSVQLPNPQEVPKSKWDVNQRRKHIMALYRDVYSPSEINKTELADEFDVSRDTIYRDIRILRKWFDKHLDKDFENIANRTIRWAIKELREEGNPKKAVDVAMDWQEFLQEEGEKEKQAEKFEIEGSSDFVDLEDMSDE